uniref:Uncharacterized protein n=1 Tax=Arundo donax TaxID=35708 RepID=A0A0A9FDB6_ARUDO
MKIDSVKTSEATCDLNSLSGTSFSTEHCFALDRAYWAALASIMQRPKAESWGWAVIGEPSVLATCKGNSFSVNNF